MRRPSKAVWKATWKAFSGAFPRTVQRRRPLPVGSRPVNAVQTHSSAAASFGKRPRAWTAVRLRALTLSTTFPLRMTSRIGTSKEGNGTLSSTPVSVRCRPFTDCGSKVPAVSRDTFTSTGPTSVSAVFERVPFREPPLFRPAASCVSWPT